MSRRKTSKPKRPRGDAMMLTVPKDLSEWLAEKTDEAEGVYYVQEVIRDILKAARDAERQGQAA